MIRYITLAPILLSLTGCDMNPLMGRPSEAQLYAEHQSQAGIPFVNPWHDTAVLTEVSVTPECASDEWRVHRCVDGIKHEWSYN